MTWNNLKNAYGDGVSSSSAYLLIYVKNDVFNFSSFLLPSICIDAEPDHQEKESFTKFDLSDQSLNFEFENSAEIEIQPQEEVEKEEKSKLTEKFDQISTSEYASPAATLEFNTQELLEKEKIINTECPALLDHPYAAASEMITASENDDEEENLEKYKEIMKQEKQKTCLYCLKLCKCVNIMKF